MTREILAKMEESRERLFPIWGDDYQEALDMCGRLVDHVPEAYTLNTILTLLDLTESFLHFEEGEISEALLTGSLEICRNLTAQDPGSCDYETAATLHVLAILHQDEREYSAEKEYQEALAILRRLTKKDRLKYEYDMLKTLYSLACLHERMGSYDAAEKEYQEVLGIVYEFYEENPELWCTRVAYANLILADLHHKMGKFKFAYYEYNIAHGFYLSLKSKYPGCFKEELEHIENMLKNIKNK